MNRLTVDINCDMGEGFGIYRLGEDEALLAHISSANVACGFHAGDPAVMKFTVRKCLAHGVRIGAHPGLPDRQSFGRRMMDISGEEAYDWTLYQIGALQAFVRSEGGSMQHVKPHGALYHLASVRRDIADAIAEAVLRADAGLIVYGPHGSELLAAAARAGLRTAGEAFADRRYAADGSLVARSQPGAVLQDAQEAAEQALSLAASGVATSADGTAVRVVADTICLHGDGHDVRSAAAAIRAKLEDGGIAVRAFR